MQVEKQVVKPYVQSKAEAARTASWRRRPVHQWRGRSLSMAALIPLLVPIAAARRRDAICRLMEENGIANTERGHRHAYATIWTDRVRRRLGDPPRPATLVRWRRKRLAIVTATLRQVPTDPRTQAFLFRGDRATPLASLSFAVGDDA